MKNCDILSLCRGVGKLQKVSLICDWQSYKASGALPVDSSLDFFLQLCSSDTCNISLRRLQRSGQRICLVLVLQEIFQCSNNFKSRSFSPAVSFDFSSSCPPPYRSRTSSFFQVKSTSSTSHSLFQKQMLGQIGRLSGVFLTFRQDACGDGTRCC